MGAKGQLRARCFAGRSDLHTSRGGLMLSQALIDPAKQVSSPKDDC